MSSMRKYVLSALLIALLLISVIGLVLKFFQSEKTLPELFQLVAQTTNLFKFTSQALLTSCILLLIALILEFVSVGKDKSTLNRIFHHRSNTLYSDVITWLLVNLGLFDFLFFVFSFGIFHYAAGFLFHSINVRIDLWISNSFLLAFVVFMVSDFKNYIFHRIMHVSPFWELHAFHHSATEFNIFTATRTHFMQRMVLILLDALLFALFQIPVTIFIGITLFDALLQYLHHSEVNWKFGWVGRWIILSPQAHRLHHSVNPAHYNKNFGSFIILWDRLFGTYADSKEPIEIGIPDNPYNKNGFVSDIILGIKNFFFALIRYDRID
jgi:sterol desaturase/sphingolipid hydroxylase (fatty acid hydroxylase superfamily)